MKKHVEEHHDGQECNFTTKVTHSNIGCLTRQIREGVLIRKCVPCMNTKSERHPPSLGSGLAIFRMKKIEIYRHHDTIL